MVKATAPKYHLFTVFALTIGLLTPLIIARSLRPIGDDYCYVTAVRDIGLIGFTFGQTATWSGAVLTNLSASLFGLLQLSSDTLAYSVTLAFAFTLTYIAFGLLTKVAFATNNPRRSLGNLGIGVILGLVYLLIGVGLPARVNSDDFPFGYASLGWAASTLSQFIPNLVLLIAAGIYVVAARRQMTPALITLVAFSLTLPLLSIQVGVAWIIFLSITAFITAIWDRTFPYRVMAAIIMALVMTALNTFSPGSQNRKTSIGDAGASDALEALINSILLSINTLFGHLVVVGLLAGVVMSFLLRPRLACIFNALKYYLILGISILISTILTDTFGAFEPWHQTGWRLAVFALSVIVGGAFGGSSSASRIVEERQKLRVFGGPLAASALLLLLVGQLILILSLLDQRAKSLDSGIPQPIGWIADTEVEWIGTCASLRE